MQSRKTGPAPIFNYRKRQRQAVVADPETLPPHELKREAIGAGHLPPPRPVASTSGQSGRGRGSHINATDTISVGRKPTVSTAAQSMIRTNGGSARTYPPVPTGTRQARPSGGQVKGARNTSHPPPAQFQPPRPPAVWEGRKAPVQQSVAQPKQKMGVKQGEQAREPSTVKDTSLRVLTLPVAQVQRLLGLHNGAMPPLLLCMFGIVDSATVSDATTQGKSFTLRDETGRVKCVFCEIDRPMPRLHRGQWYRVVGIMKVAWGGLQCLSIRTVSIEERQAARNITSQCQTFLSNLCHGIIEQ